MASCRKYFGLVLIAVYAFFFASTNFFYHSHQLTDNKLVHSHPFSAAGHTHTTSQIILIDAADSASYQEAADLSVPDFIPVCPVISISLNVSGPVLSPVIFSFSLRAPPASC